VLLPSSFCSSANSASLREADGEISEDSRGLADKNSVRFGMGANLPAEFPFSCAEGSRADRLLRIERQQLVCSPN
jgi:hypothetical protein